ncbi:MAG: AEC family transporter [Akkermansiaceae bacterium]|nr:AEC family transporter [Akkermansiaceae bacterium]
MQESLLVLQAAFPIYIIVVLGAMLRRTAVLTPEMDRGIMTMTVQLFMPCLILDKMLGAEILRDAGVVISAASVGFVVIAVGMMLGYGVGRIMGLEMGGGRRTFAVSSGLQNFGYIALPLMLYVFPDDNNVLAVLFTHNLGVELALWSVGLMLISGNFKPSWRAFLKGPIIAVIMGIILVQTRLDQHVPSIIGRVFSMLGECAVPVALLLVGTTLHDLARKMKFDWKISTGGILVRLALVPFFMLCLAKFLPLATELKQVLVIQAAMPAGMFPILMSRHYGGRADVAIQVVVATTLVSLLTMPVIVYWGMKWLGL